MRCSNLKDLSNGVIWCRLMTKLWPGSLATVLVINRPANSNDAQHNYMLLEAAFNKVEMPWAFQTRQLIAGHSAELLRMAEAMVTMDNIFKMQMKEQRKTKQAANKSSRSSRILAGELPSEQPPTSSLNLNAPPPPPESLLQASASAATAAAVAAVAAVHTQPTNEEVTSTTILSEAQLLRQEIRSMFHQQQSAMEAYMAQQEQLVASGGGHAYAALCFCPECIRQRQNAQIAMQTAADTPEVHEANDTHEPHMAQETHATHEAHVTLATHGAPNAPMKEI